MSSAARHDSPAPDPLLELVRLRRDLTSAQVRNRTLMRELTRAASAPTIVGVLKGPDRECDEIVFLSNGIRLEHRWDADRGWRYVQAECVPFTLAAVVDGVFASPSPREMAVVL